MHLGSRKAHFVCIVIAGPANAAENIAQLRLVVEKPQQGMAACALRADSENVFGGRVQRDDQQITVDQNDARAQAVQDGLGVPVRAAVAARLPG